MFQLIVVMLSLQTLLLVTADSSPCQVHMSVMVARSVVTFPGGKDHESKEERTGVKTAVA